MQFKMTTHSFTCECGFAIIHVSLDLNWVSIGYQARSTNRICRKRGALIRRVCDANLTVSQPAARRLPRSSRSRRGRRSTSSKATSSLPLPPRVSRLVCHAVRKWRAEN